MSQFHRGFHNFQGTIYLNRTKRMLRNLGVSEGCGNQVAPHASNKNCANSKNSFLQFTPAARVVPHLRKDRADGAQLGFPRARMRSTRVYAFGSATYSPKVRHGALDENFMQIGLATSEDIQDWAARSYLIGGKYIQIGEVKKADTINYRTFKPEKDGLFCERIFGPVNDWICSCGTSFRGGTPTTLGSESGTVARNSRFPIFNPITFRFARSASELGDPSTLDAQQREGASERNTRMLDASQSYNYQDKGGDEKGGGATGTDPQRPEISRGKLSGVPSERWGEQDERYSRGGHIPSICPQCQVEFTLSRIRRYRMGYIGLACSVTHIWYLNSRPNLFSVLFKMPTKYVKKITYYKGYTPSDPKLWNPCLGPGGDFFDTEWEFLHRWLGAREANSGVGVQSLAASSLVVPGQLPDFLGSESSQGLRSSNRETLSEFDSLESGYLATGTNLDGQANHATSFSLFPGCTPSVRFPSKAVWSSARGKIQENNLPSSLGLSPSWLENTGACAFQKYLENRNWEKDFQKLQEELRRTPRAILSNPRRVKLATGTSSSSTTSEKLAQLTPSASIRYEASNQSNTLTLVATHPYNTEAFLLKRRKKRVRSFKLLNIFRTAGGADCFLSSGLILDRIPVLPPELRPIVQLNAGQLASSDVNDLYRRVISRNNRLKYYLTGCGPHPVEFLVRSERHLVQLAVDALLENGKTTNVRHGGRGSAGTGSGNGPPYKSLSDRIGGKQGRFRQNLLGKRVDYSGRSVIVVGPKLKLHQCGLPYEMAMELFQAFLIRHIMELQLAKTIRGAKNLIRANQPLARQLLQNVVESHPILLNRAPTLHRLGIQAFQPKLISGRAIQLHPLVCTAFNADFDGDQMAVHVPLSPKSRIEARLLMLANTNWLSVATGQPSILPSQDMVLGFYYLTIERPSTRLIPSKVSAGPSDSLSGVSKHETALDFQSRSNMGFALGSGYGATLEDVIQAYESGQLNLHTAVWVRSSVAPHHLGALMNTSPPPHRTKVRIGHKAYYASKNSLNKAREIEYARRSTSGLGRSGKTPDEPLHLRISGSGTFSKLYTSYKWLEDSQERRRSTYLRTTPGRILVNNIIQSFIG